MMSWILSHAVLHWRGVRLKNTSWSDARSSTVQYKWVGLRAD